MEPKKPEIKKYKIKTFIKFFKDYLKKINQTEKIKNIKEEIKKAISITSKLAEKNLFSSNHIISLGMVYYCFENEKIYDEYYFNEIKNPFLNIIHQELNDEIPNYSDFQKKIGNISHQTKIISYISGRCSEVLNQTNYLQNFMFLIIKKEFDINGKNLLYKVLKTIKKEIPSNLTFEIFQKIIANIDLSMEVLINFPEQLYIILNSEIKEVKMEEIKEKEKEEKKEEIKEVKMEEIKEKEKEEKKEEIIEVKKEEIIEKVKEVKKEEIKEDIKEEKNIVDEKNESNKNESSKKEEREEEESNKSTLTINNEKFYNQMNELKEDMENKISKIQTEMNKNVTELNDKINQLLIDRKNDNKKIIQLVDENCKLKEDISTLKEKVNKLVDENSKLKEKLNKLLDENSKLKEKVTILKENINQLVDDNYKYKEKVNKLKDEKSKLKEEVSTLKEKISKLVDENSKLKEKVNKLVDENTKLKEKVNKLENKNVEMKNELNALFRGHLKVIFKLILTNQQLVIKIIALDRLRNFFTQDYLNRDSNLRELYEGNNQNKDNNNKENKKK